MKTQILLAGAAAIALTASVAYAAGGKSAGAYAEPSQPIAYSKLDAYLKASPKKRAHGDWALSTSAPTGTPANASMTTPPPASGDMGAGATTTPQTQPSTGAPDTGTAPPPSGGQTP